MAFASEFKEYCRTANQQYATGAYLNYLLGQVVLPRGRGAQDSERLRIINQKGKELKSLSIDSLQEKALALKAKVRNGVPLDSVLEDSFAIVREMSGRVLGLYHYDVQILGGLALARGGIAEMATGEGKTLVQLLPAYYYGLEGKGVHVATANSYLAGRDHEFGTPVLDALGISSAILPERAATHQKRMAYAADVTYGTGSEFGFDYLRDQLSILDRPECLVGEKIWDRILGREPLGLPLAQRGLNVAVIDEADSILIDEAVTPLLISGRSADENPNTSIFEAAREIVGQLKEDQHFEKKDNGRRIKLLEDGFKAINDYIPKIDPKLLKRPWFRYVENALKAEYTLTRDRQYLVRDDKILIIDEFTGRVKEGSSWREGMHQAVEVKESTTVTCESESQASISRQKFYQLYNRVCGMTGTGKLSAGEFWKVYHLPVIPIARHKPNLLELWPPKVFATLEDKLFAIVEEIRRLHWMGRPILVGTRSIATSEILAERLGSEGISHQLLNANRDSEEAEIIKGAGQIGSITISTNMAGRGTHIDLGDGVEELGGLHVIISEMDESKRIDDQLIGRAARQGKPGSAQMFLSLEDTLIVKYEPELAEKFAGKAINSALAFKHFERIQNEAETNAYYGRLAIMEQDRLRDETKLRLS